jgi:hypothetical protein
LLQDELGAELGRRGGDRDLAVGLAVGPGDPVFQRRRDVGDLAARVATLALERAPTVTRSSPIQVPRRELLEQRIRGVHFLHLSRTSGAWPGPLATVTPGGWGPGDSTMIEAIRKKEERLATYVADTGIPEQWLLLVTGEGYVQPTDSVMVEWTRVATTFARVYLLDVRTGELLRVDAEEPLPPPPA